MWRCFFLFYFFYQFFFLLVSQRIFLFILFFASLIFLAVWIFSFSWKVFVMRDGVLAVLCGDGLLCFSLHHYLASQWIFLLFPFLTSLFFSSFLKVFFCFSLFVSFLFLLAEWILSFTQKVVVVGDGVLANLCWDGLRCLSLYHCLASLSIF